MAPLQSITEVEDVVWFLEVALLRWGEGFATCTVPAFLELVLEPDSFDLSDERGFGFCSGGSAPGVCALSF